MQYTSLHYYIRAMNTYVKNNRIFLYLFYYLKKIAVKSTLQKTKSPFLRGAGMGIEMVLCVKLHQKLMR